MKITACGDVKCNLSEIKLIWPDYRLEEQSVDSESTIREEENMMMGGISDTMMCANAYFLFFLFFFFKQAPLRVNASLSN